MNPSIYYHHPIHTGNSNHITTRELEYLLKTGKLNSLIKIIPSYQIMQLLLEKHLPGIKHNNKYFTAETRIYQCINLQEDILRHINKLGRYLRIRYHSQPTTKPTIKKITYLIPRRYPYTKKIPYSSKPCYTNNY